MFSKLREKLKNWTKKISESTEKLGASLDKTEKKPSIKGKAKIKQKNILLPKKFNAGQQQYLPDTDKIREIEDELLEEEKPLKEKESFFSKIKSKIQKIKISEREFDIYSEELEMLLLENNVALEVAEEIIKKLRERIVGQSLLRNEIESEIKDIFKEIIGEILVEPFDIIEKIKSRPDKSVPFVILFCGINGTGKTTTVAKIADFLKKNNLSCILAAADTFRAASIEQLQTHAKRLGVKIVSHEYGSDPASVGFDAIQSAKKNHIDCVLIDTAGRMHTARNLLKEIEKISRVCKPDLKLFVGESITGNDAIEQAKSFNWSIQIDGIILTKADIDEKGGTALSVGFVTKKPILYLGTGQDYDAIEVFDKKKFIEKLGL
ncbi:MAG TPA: signal recognition particle-docking protein FtsY [Candidatus Nanoarchaeia archaeon]|nr:signal recognition particle-docking protein FtsY [Candidatus Nanoarchaeia archaeon]